MNDADYIRVKLTELADQGELSIAERILALTAEATKTGNLSSSRYHLFAREELKRGFREVLEKIARILIDIKATKEGNELIRVSDRLRARLLDTHWVALFGSPAFERDAAANRDRGMLEIKTELEAMCLSVLEDAKRGIVGHTRYGSPDTEEVNQKRNRRTKKETFTLVEPKPPALFEHIAWILKYGREHKILAGIAVILLVGSIVSGILGVGKEMPIWGSSSSGEKSSDEKFWDNTALRVRFKDGVFGYVTLNVTTRVNPTKVIDLVRTYGEQKRAVSELLGAVRSAAYTILETMSVAEVRQNRSSIEKSIIDMTKDAQERTFHIIDRVSILEIDTGR